MKPRTNLLISGPSGGGKSTLIRQLADGTLAPEILNRLPAGSGGWTVIEANDVVKGDLSAGEFQAKIHAGACLVHYDIVFIHHRGIANYADDPALSMMAAADSVDLVFVRPACESLRKQFIDRQARHHRTKSTGSLLWRRFIRRPLRRALAAVAGKPSMTTAELYADSQWLENCYRQWESFIGTILDKHPSAKSTIVEPVSGPGEAPTFRLVTPD